MKWYPVVQQDMGMGSLYFSRTNFFACCFSSEVQDGTIIRGQNEISHPTNGSLQLIDKVHLYFLIFISCMQIVK